MYYTNSTGDNDGEQKNTLMSPNVSIKKNFTKKLFNKCTSLKRS